MSDGGKGSKQRPTNKEAYDEAYEKIWDKRKKSKDDLYYDNFGPSTLKDSDSEMLRDIRYDVKYMPEDHYEE